MEAMLIAEKMSTTTTATTTQTEQTGEGEAGLQKPDKEKNSLQTFSRSQAIEKDLDRYLQSPQPKTDTSP